MASPREIVDAPPDRTFADRRQAGRRLAAKIIDVSCESPRGGFLATPILDCPMPPVVLTLPRGGVPVGFEVAAAPGAPLDVLMARKIGAPGNPELGIGAVAEGGVRVLSEDVLRSLLVSQEELEHSVLTAETEMRRRVRLYRGDRPPIALAGMIAIIVDDGLATGGTARAAIGAARRQGAKRVMLATPVGAASTVDALRAEGEEVICLLEPEAMWAIGMWYRDFSQVPDHEVLALLGRAREHARDDRRAPAAIHTAHPSASTEVSIPYGNDRLALGDLAVPKHCRGLVLFAHGSGSGRGSPRNREVATALNDRRIGTLLFDLLTPEEERLRTNVFDISLLASRLRLATGWVREQPRLASLPIGYFGASTGAAAALRAAAELNGQIDAVVSRGGRPDLALPHLGEVTAAVLLIVGGADAVVLDLNRQALEQLHSPAQLEVVPGATHLFEEPGALQEVARLAGRWLTGHLGSTSAAPEQSS